MAEKKITKEKLSAFVTKATEKGKQAVADIQQSQQEWKEKKTVEKREKDIQKYRPLSLEEYKSADFRIPNIINIVNDTDVRNIKVCDGAIGWREYSNGEEVLNLYDEYINETGIKFLPSAQYRAIYCRDFNDKSKKTFICIDNIFERTANEKIAELSNIAFCLGAKRCHIEIVQSRNEYDGYEYESSVGLSMPTFSEQSSNEKENKEKTGEKKETVPNDFGASLNRSKSSSNTSTQSSKKWICFEGERAPEIPKLKWFKHDDNIRGLIDMRCGGKGNVKSIIMEIKCSQGATMSESTAVAIDGILSAGIIGKVAKLGNVGAKASTKYQTEHKKEMKSKLIFEIEF